MASSDFWQKLSSSAGRVGRRSRRQLLEKFAGTAKMWMVMDVLTVFLAAMGATLYKFHTTP